MLSLCRLKYMFHVIVQNFKAKKPLRRPHSSLWRWEIWGPELPSNFLKATLLDCVRAVVKDAYMIVSIPSSILCFLKIRLSIVFNTYNFNMVFKHKLIYQSFLNLTLPEKLVLMLGANTCLLLDLTSGKLGTTQ